MPEISRETIESIKQIPLYEVVSPVVKLARSGRNWVGLSPFSDEKTPSFYVISDKNFFKCFSSGLAGDAIRFVQETENLTFVEAVETLAERFSIQIQYSRGEGPSQEERSLRRQLLDLHDYATNYFHEQFMGDTDTGREIREYWTQERGFSLDLAKRFKVGFAPPEGQQLNELLLKKGFFAQALEQSGLFYPRGGSRHAGSWKNRFRGRLMIPIRNFQDQVVAFTARQLKMTPESDPTSKAKYINSPETPIFVKGNMLFNLNEARLVVKETDRFLMVEGQLDALRCWDSGFKEAVAPQGTSVTLEQFKLLKRYADRVDVLLDGDQAGQNAALRLLPIALRTGIDLRVMALPPGNDPDTLLKKNGSQALGDIEKSATSGIRYAAQAIIPSNPSPQQRNKALEVLFEHLLECESEVLREACLEEAIAELNVPPAAARRDFQRYRQRQQRPVARKFGESKKKASSEQKKLTNTESDLLWIVLQNANWAEALAAVIDHDWIDSTKLEGKVLARILNEAQAGNWEGVDFIDELLENDDERAVYAEHYVKEPSNHDFNNLANQCLENLLRRHFRRQLEEIDAKITENTESGLDSAKLRELFEARRDINRERMQLSPPRVHLQPGEAASG